MNGALMINDLLSGVEIDWVATDKQETDDD